MRVMLALIPALVAAASPGAAGAQTVTPIQFARGASSATVNGSITGDRFVDYRLSVREGQQMSVRLQVQKGSAYFNVLEPGSADVAIYNSSMGEQAYQGTTARSGAYTIRVYQMRASARRGETATFRLTAGVTGASPAGGASSAGGASAAGGAPTHRAGDALVPGTPYHATATIRCRTAAGAAMGNCSASVIRRPASATIHLDTPDGGERTILFREGRAISSDSSNHLTAERRGDTSIVSIGSVEVYEIPDALVEGG